MISSSMKRSNSARYSTRSAGKEKSISRILGFEGCEGSPVSRIIRLIDPKLLQRGRKQMCGHAGRRQPTGSGSKRIGQLRIERGQSPGVAEQRLQALKLRVLAVGAEFTLATREIDGICGDPRLKGGVWIGLRHYGIAQECGNGGKDFVGTRLVLHWFGSRSQFAMRRSRSISVSEVRRAIMARSTEASTLRKAASEPVHMTPQRSVPNISHHLAMARFTGGPPAAS